jgi:hypothetical protein
LAIGATTAVFSVIYAALLNPYPYPTANRIVRLTVTSKTTPDETVELNGSQVIQLQQLQPVESVLAMDYQAMILTGRDVPENVNEIGLISTGFNDLGLPPLLGWGGASSLQTQSRDAIRSPWWSCHSNSGRSTSSAIQRCWERHWN